MSKRENALCRQKTLEFRLEAAGLAQLIGANQASTKLGNTVEFEELTAPGSYGHAGRGNVEKVEVRRPDSELEGENARLRRELASTRHDLEIRKAAVYFAKQSR